MSKTKADIIAVCDGMVAAMNAAPASFSLTFTAVREYLTTIKLEDLTTGDPRVVVVPVSHDASAETRELTQRDFEIHIGIQKKLPSEYTTGDVDALMLFVDDIQTFFENPANRNVAINTGTPRTGIITGFLNDAGDPAYSMDHLKEFRQFTSVLRTGVRVY